MPTFAIIDGADRSKTFAEQRPLALLARRVHPQPVALGNPMSQVSNRRRSTSPRSSTVFAPRLTDARGQFCLASASFAEASLRPRPRFARFDDWYWRFRRLMRHQPSCHCRSTPYVEAHTWTTSRGTREAMTTAPGAGEIDLRGTVARRPPRAAGEGEGAHARPRRSDADRRRLPMVRITKDYVFEGPGQDAPPRSLRGSPTALVYHFMFGPTGAKAVLLLARRRQHRPLAHLHARDTSLALVSRAPLAGSSPQAADGLDGSAVFVVRHDFDYELHITHGRESVAPVDDATREASS